MTRIEVHSATDMGHTDEQGIKRKKQITGIMGIWIHYVFSKSPTWGIWARVVSNSGIGFILGTQRYSPAVLPHKLDCPFDFELHHFHVTGYGLKA